MNLDIMIDGERIGRLNQRLIIQKNLTEEEVELIKELHVKTYLLGIDFLNKEISAEIYCDTWTEYQYQLQDAWKFDRNHEYHKFWEMRGCVCPKMDNEDNWPSGYYAYNASCPVHGYKFEEMLNGCDGDA